MARLSGKKRIALSIIGVLLIALFTCWYWVTSTGRAALLDLAREGKFCKTEQCDEGVDYAATYLGDEFGLSPRMVKWCMGVDNLALGENHGRTKSALINLLYMPCGDPMIE